jgi:hypothetical protein
MSSGFSLLPWCSPAGRGRCACLVSASRWSWETALLCSPTLGSWSLSRLGSSKVVKPTLIARR